MPGSRVVQLPAEVVGMRIVEPVTEDEVVALFLKTEVESVRFRDAILKLLFRDGRDRAIVDDPDTSDAGQNS
jgi:hypothetical protein